MHPNYVYTAQDEYGDLAVIDQDGLRVLSFGVSDEQSIQLKDKPYLLQHAYTQAMMTSLLFCQPKRVLLLGLGAGSLLQALHHAVPGVRIDGVELRAEVINIARRFFRLPSSKKIAIHCQDALGFLHSGLDKKVDLIMTDLYDDHGMDVVQVSTEYLDLCFKNLKDNGWLVINCWGEKDDHRPLFAKLKRDYADVRSLEAEDGNLIIFAGKQRDLKSKSELKEQALKVNPKLGFSLGKYLVRIAL